MLIDSDGTLFSFHLRFTVQDDVPKSMKIHTRYAWKRERHDIDLFLLLVQRFVLSILFARAFTDAPYGSR